MAILNLYMKQLWNARVHYLCLLEVIWNSREWFKEDLLFLIDLVETAIHEKVRCSGALICKLEEKKILSSNALYCESTSLLFVLEDHY